MGSQVVLCVLALSQAKCLPDAAVEQLCDDVADAVICMGGDHATRCDTGAGADNGTGKI
jgi:hypothetical protein